MHCKSFLKFKITGARVGKACLSTTACLDQTELGMRMKMLAFTRPTSPRGFALTLAVVTLATPGFFTGAALADKVALSGTYSQSDILRSCVGAGGDFTFLAGMGVKAAGRRIGSASCTNGKNGPPTISTGQLSKPTAPSWAYRLGTTQKAGANAPPVHGPGSSHNPIVATPVENHPVILERSGEEHSGKQCADNTCGKYIGPIRLCLANNPLWCLACPLSPKKIRIPRFFPQRGHGPPNYEKVDLPSSCQSILMASCHNAGDA